MAEYTLAPALQRATLDDYVRLCGASFEADAKITKPYLQWQYIDNPHGQVIGFDAFMGGQLAAHYAIIPRRYTLDSQPFLGALSVNTATHPQHQGKKLFTRLAEASYDAAAAKGVQFVVGAANANSVGGFTRRLGFDCLGQARLFVGFRAPRHPASALGLDVDADWLAWRLANPSRQYEALEHRDATWCTLRTRVKGVPFNIGRVRAEALRRGCHAAVIGHGNALLPALTPLFDLTPTRGVRLPLRLQPSPWHVIWRSLSASVDKSFATHFRLDGLGMDTF